MSKHSPAKRIVLSAADDGSQSAASSAASRSIHLPAQSTLPPSSQAHRGDASSERPLTLPPLSRASSMTDDTSDQSRQGRGLGMHSILNPQREAQEPRGVRRKAEEIESSSSAEAASTRRGSISSLVQSRVSSGDVSPANSQVGFNTFPGLPSRRMLSPRSQVPRLASLSTLRMPTGTLPVQDNPFLASAGPNSAVESAPGGAPLPTPPAAPIPGYNFPAVPTPPIPESRRPSGAMQLPIHSSSASPSTQVSTFSQASRNSPALQLGIPADQSRNSYNAPPTQVPGAPMHDRERPQGIPVSSTGHSSYQLMTFNTASGAVQFPVDVQAASRAADDKRRRNAGASARFRARRKEKEREASTTISRLEQHLKESKEDADFYRRERDFLRAALLQLQGGEQHFPRPASPRQRREHGSSDSGGSGSGSGSYASPFQNQRQLSVPLSQQGSGSAGYSPPAPAPPSAMPRGPYQSAYPPLQDPARQPGQIPRVVPPGSQPLPPPQPQRLPQHQLSHTATPGPRKSPPYDTYGTENYERSWPPGPRTGGR